MASHATHINTTTSASAQRRREELRHLLIERRQELMAALTAHMQTVRVDHSAQSANGVFDEEETAVGDVQEGIELALLGMRAETLALIDQALARLEAGRYGQCRECAQDIASSRLRALPFAARCRACEEERETAGTRTRRSSVDEFRASRA
jgi:DnaK suppressor protein